MGDRAGLLERGGRDKVYTARCVCVLTTDRRGAGERDDWAGEFTGDSTAAA